MEEIPSIDVGPLRGAGDRAECGHAICEALHRSGFLYVENHGVDAQLIADLFSLSREFFAQPVEEKKKVSMAHGGLAWRGYFPVGDELTSGVPDRKEGIYFGQEQGPTHPGVQRGLPLHGPNQWPSFPPSLKSHVLTYMGQMAALGRDLMEGVGLGLGLEPGYFLERFTAKPTTLFRIFNYPRHAWEGDEWGVREHTDMGFLTLLLQDESGGLQARSSHGAWVDVPPRPGTFVVNIGDMLELWTHGIFRATPHRVRNQGAGDRLSLPFFFDPAWSAPLQPIDLEKVDPNFRERTRPPDRERWDGLDLTQFTRSKTYGDYVWEKVKGVFPQFAP